MIMTLYACCHYHFTAENMVGLEIIIIIISVWSLFFSSQCNAASCVIMRKLYLPHTQTLILTVKKLIKVILRKCVPIEAINMRRHSHHASRWIIALKSTQECGTLWKITHCSWHLWRARTWLRSGLNTFFSRREGNGIPVVFTTQSGLKKPEIASPSTKTRWFVHQS